MSACRCTPAGVAHGHVLDWLHLQFLSSASGTLQSSALGKGLYACHGQWLDRSYLERLRIVKLQSGTCTLGRAQTTGTTKKAGRAKHQTDQRSEAPISLAAFGSST